jgi:hypothetical protein
VTDYTFTLTARAKARGWDAAFGAGVVRVKDGQSGRGGRARASGTRQLRGCRVTVVSRQGLVGAVLPAFLLSDREGARPGSRWTNRADPTDRCGGHFESLDLPPSICGI